MLKNSVIIKIFCVIATLFFLWGCNNQSEAPQAPQVVSKKIAKAPPPKDSKPASFPKAVQPKPAPPPAKAEVPPKVAATPPATTKKVEPPKAAPPLKKEMVKPIPAKGGEPPKPVTPQEKAQAAPETAAQATGAEKAKTPGVASVATAEQPAPSTDKPEEKKAGAFQPIYLSDVYDPTGKIDPFLPLYKEEPVVKKETIKAKKKIRRLPLTPLEKVDLSQLKLVGVINAPSGNKALVEEASGKGYIVKKGTYIGIHGGRVVAILSDRIVVEEQVETTLGTYQLQKRELKINKPPGEM